MSFLWNFFGGLVPEILTDLWDFFWNYREEVCKSVVVGAGGTILVVFSTGLLAAMGFTSAGIAAGSLAAKLMSYFAVLNGGGVASGGLVAILQSLGATGLSWSAIGLEFTAGGILGWILSRVCNTTENT